MRIPLNERLSWALNRAGRRPADLARALGCSTAAVSGWTTGRRKSISGENLTRAAAFLGVSVEWLASGEGNPTANTSEVIERLSPDVPGVSYVKVWENRVSMRAGGAADLLASLERIPEIPPELCPAAMFEEADADPASCIFLKAPDDEMKPLVCAGDRLLVDCSKDQKIANGAVYALCCDGHLCIRRLQKKISGAIVLIADNPRVESEEVSVESWNANVRLIGRVIERRSRNLDMM